MPTANKIRFPDPDQWTPENFPDPDDWSTSPAVSRETLPPVTPQPDIAALFGGVEPIGQPDTSANAMSMLGAGGSFATTPEPATTKGRSFGVEEKSDLKIEIPRFPLEADPERPIMSAISAGGQALGSEKVLAVNALLGALELQANIPAFVLDLIKRPEQLSPVGEGPEGEKKLQIPPLLKDIVTPAAKLAAGVTVRGESKAGTELFEEARKESFERPEGVALPLAVALGGPRAVRGAGKLIKRAVKGKAKAAPEVKPTPTAEEVLGVDTKAQKIEVPFDPKLEKKAPQKPVATPEEALGAVVEKQVVAPETPAKPVQKAVKPKSTPKGEKPATGKAKEPHEMTKAEFEQDFEFHGSQAEVSGGKLELGQAMGGDAGGIFTTKSRSLANEFVSGKGKIHRVDTRGRKVLDLTDNKGIEFIEKQIGQEYIVNDVTGETGTFTKQQFDFLFPEVGGKRQGADWATFDSYIPLFEKLGFDGVKLWENTLKELKSTSFFKGGLKVFDESHQNIIKQALAEGKPVPNNVLADYPDLVKKPLAETPKAEPKPKPTVEPAETAEATLAIRTEADAIAKKLTEGFGELPKSEKMNMRKQYEESLKLIDRNYNDAVEMALGKKEIPVGSDGKPIEPARLFNSVKERALAKGDVETLRVLATESTIPLLLKKYGQAIKAADDGLFNDPVRVMQDIVDIRKQRAERTGKKITDAEIKRLTTELETLQKAFDERVSRVTKRKPAKYGSRNKIVDTVAYENAKREISRTISELGANPFANPKVFADAIKIGTYHLEAGTRLFADWSVRMVSDLGKNVKPHLEDMWKKINEDKKLRTALKAQKTRLTKETETLTRKLETLDLTRPERRKLKLDKEAKRLKKERDRAKENLEAARSVSGTITKAEAQNIVKLSEATEKARIEMEKGGDRLKYGAARVIQERYVNSLKGEDGPLKTQLRQRAQEFKTTFKDDKLTAISDLGKDVFDQIFDTSIAMVASWDNSFIGRQGISTFYRNKRIWAKAARSSFADFGKTIGGKRAHDALLADIYSRENFLNGNYQKAKILTMIEEEIPSSLPGRIPILGRVFKASESAFTGSGMRMRTSLFDFLNEKAKRNGVDVTSKAHLEDMGSLINSLTGRGKLGKGKGRSRILRVAMWAPKLLKGNWDVLTAHTFGFGLKTKFARKEAALNITKMAIETATILYVADTLVPGSVEWDPNSAAFGMIKVGDTRFDITGGKKALVTLGSRLITGKRKNLKGENIEYGPGFAQRSEFDAIVSFAVNKTPPVTRAAIDLLKGVDFNFEPVTPLKTIKGVIAPITVQQALELGDNASADRVLGVILDAVGVSSFTVDKKKKKKKKKSISPFGVLGAGSQNNKKKKTGSSDFAKFVGGLQD